MTRHNNIDKQQTTKKTTLTKKLQTKTHDYLSLGKIRVKRLSDKMKKIARYITRKITKYAVHDFTKVL